MLEELMSVEETKELLSSSFSNKVTNQKKRRRMAPNCWNNFLFGLCHKICRRSIKQMAEYKKNCKGRGDKVKIFV